MEGIILAAGKSSRYVRNKMLEPFRDSTVLEETIKTMAMVCSKIYVITGHYSYDFNIPSVTFVYNNDYENGMYTSIQKGLSLIEESEVLLIPGDMPLVEKEVYEKLLSVKGDVVLPSYQMKSGHPIKITRPVIDRILVTHDTTLRDLLGFYEKVYVSVSSDSILLDIDEVDDYKEMIRRLT